MEHERLFLVSVLGFIVNIIGIFVFHHGGGKTGMYYNEMTSLEIIETLSNRCS